MTRVILFAALVLSVICLLTPYSEAVTPRQRVAKKWSRPGFSAKQSKRKHFLKKAGQSSTKDIYENDVIFGYVDIPGFALDSGWMLEWSGFDHVTFTVVPLSGSDRFSFQYNTCDGTYSGNGYCEITFRFDPEVEDVVEAEVMFQVDHYFEGSSFPDTDYYYFSLYGGGIQRPLTCDGQVRGVGHTDTGTSAGKGTMAGYSGGSGIRATDRALAEDIPLVGTDLSLRYSTRFSPEYTPEDGTFVFTPKYSFAENGWAFSPHKMYDPLRKRLFSADGTVEFRPFAEVDTDLIGVVSSDGEEAYIFTEDGQHLQTLTTLTGAVKYEFEYDSHDRLNKIIDRDGLETTITRNSSGRITGFLRPTLK